MRKPLAFAVLALLLVSLSACVGQTPTPGASAIDPSKPQIVASINVWGQLAQEIGGDNVEVTNIISDPSKDPHSYEATARDQLAINNADLVIINGGGYDDFMDKLVSAGSDKAEQIKASQLFAGDSNPHYWYAPSYAARVCEEIFLKLSTIDKPNLSEYQANYSSLKSKLDALVTQTADLKKITTGYTYFSTEPIADYLLLAAGFVNATPKAFGDAIENETDVPPLVMQESLGMIKNHTVKYLVVNKQTRTSQVDQLINAARDAEVRAVAFVELLPDGESYIEWMSANLRTLNPGM